VSLASVFVFQLLQSCTPASKFLIIDHEGKLHFGVSEEAAELVAFGIDNIDFYFLYRKSLSHQLSSNNAALYL